MADCKWLLLLLGVVARGVWSLAPPPRDQCTGVVCSTPKCVNPVTEAGECCQTCPQGENCWLGGDTISAGIDVVQNSGEPSCPILCGCPTIDIYEQQGTMTQAICTYSCNGIQVSPQLIALEMRSLDNKKVRSMNNPRFPKAKQRSLTGDGKDSFAQFKGLKRALFVDNGKNVRHDRGLKGGLFKEEDSFIERGYKRGLFREPGQDSNNEGGLKRGLFTDQQDSKNEGGLKRGLFKEQEQDSNFEAGLKRGLFEGMKERRNKEDSYRRGLFTENEQESSNKFMGALKRGLFP